MTNEAFARVKIDALLAAQGWDTLDTNAVRFEVQLPDGTRADYVLCDRHGRSLAVIEAKRYSVSPGDAAAQAKAYAQQLGVPYAFLCNGNEVLFWEWQREAYPRSVKTIFKQDDLERRIATLSVRRDPASVAIDRRIVERDYQIECIDTLCRDIGLGRRKLLVEMATGTGKTRTAAAFIKRLFEANAITRVLFLVDRIPLAKQTEDAFAEHLPGLPGLCAARGPALPGREAHHHHYAAEHGEPVRGVLQRLLRPGHQRRVPPQHLRPVERRAAALRWRAGRPHGDALRGRP